MSAAANIGLLLSGGKVRNAVICKVQQAKCPGEEFIQSASF